MKLITTEIKKQLLKADNPEATLEEQTVLYKLFFPIGAWTWYVISMPNDNVLYGIVVGHEIEVGYFGLEEVENLCIRGLSVEQDMSFTPVNAAKFLAKLKEERYV